MMTKCFVRAPLTRQEFGTGTNSAMFTVNPGLSTNLVFVTQLPYQHSCGTSYCMTPTSDISNDEEQSPLFLI